MKYKHLTLAAFGFLGGIVGSLVFTSTASIAAKEGHLYLTNFHNNNGKRIAVIAGSQPTGDGQFFLFNNAGKSLIQMGSYPAGLEKGQSLIGMHDPNGYLRFLTRMHGPENSPTIVMKDSRGSDRIVFGLDGTTQQPYFRYMDKKGRMQNLIPK